MNMLGWEAKKQIKELLNLISLGEKICIAVNKAKSFKGECNEVMKLVSRLSQMLKTLFRFISSANTPLYLRPVKCIIAKVNDHFQLAAGFVHKCNRRNLLWRFFTGSNATQFRELYNRLNTSINDMEWLLSIYDGSRLTACKNSAKFLVWSYIAAVKMGRELKDQVQAAERLTLLAQQNDEYKNIIYEEGGVPTLQKLFKENSEIMALKALCLLANKEERKFVIMKEMVSTILNRLSRTSPIWEQMEAADSVARIAEDNPELKEYELIRENVIWRLVSLFSSADDHKPSSLKLELKLSCSKALWMLVKGSVLNCSTLAETKGMLCLAKLLKTEKDELQYNCLIIIREITALAESNEEFRHSTFKSSSPAAKAVVDELLRVIEEFDDLKLKIPAIKSVGSLARSFSAKESRVISPLVAGLADTDREVATEASIALEKFVCTSNHLCSEHSKTIVGFNGVPLLMKLLHNDEDMKLQSHGLRLICYLANHDINSNVLIKAEALTALEKKGPTVAKEQPELEKMVSEAISKLRSNKTDEHEVLNSSPGIKRFITEQSKVVFDFIRRQLKLLLGGLSLTVYLLQVQGDWKSCKKGISQAIRSSKTRRIGRLVKAKCVELALTIRSVMEFSGKKVIMKEIARKLRLLKKISESLEKKDIRRKFGYIIHKINKINKLLIYLFRSLFIFSTLCGPIFNEGRRWPKGGNTPAVLFCCYIMGKVYWESLYL